MPGGEKWRLLPFDEGPVASHIAFADALVRVGQKPSVWWHAARETTLVLGAAQFPDDAMYAGAREAGVVVVKRHAGGTAVLATPDVLGLDVLLPRDHPLAHADVVENYRLLGDTWHAALGRLGIASRVVPVAEAKGAPLPSPHVANILRAACFGTLSPYEIVVHGRKVVGHAQVRRAHNTLLSSGVHWHLDAPRLVALLSGEDDPAAASELERRAAGLDRYLDPPPTRSDVMRAWEEALRELFGIALVPGTWTSQEIEYADRALTIERDSGM